MRMSQILRACLRHGVRRWVLLSCSLLLLAFLLAVRTAPGQSETYENSRPDHLHAGALGAPDNTPALSDTTSASPVATNISSSQEGTRWVSPVPSPDDRAAAAVGKDNVPEEEARVAVNDSRQLEEVTQTAEKEVQAAGPRTLAVTMHSNLYHPAELTIPAGTTVRWDNGEAIPHTVNAKDSKFDSGLIMNKGASWSFLFNTPGIYNYYCILHPAMLGKVTVQEVRVTPPSPSDKETPASAAPVVLTPEHDFLQLSENVSAADLPISPSLTNPVYLTLDSVSFSQPSLTINPGKTVFWLNTSHLPHAISDSSGLFASEIFMPGTFFAYTFVQPGTYYYGCYHHEGMYGSITVTGTPLQEAPMPKTVPVPEPIPAPIAPVPEPTPQPAPQAATSSPVIPTVLEKVTVSMGTSTFSPVSISVNARGTIVWTNTSSLPHTVTASDRSFDSGILIPGASFFYSFSRPGTLNYTCILHQGMNGSITITESSVAGPTASPQSAAPAPAQPPAPSMLPPVEPLPPSVGELVIISNSGYSLPTLTIAPGRIVHWMNRTREYHTVTASSEAFDSGIMLPGVTFSFNFTRPGTYNYTCQFHPQMSGTITVTGIPGTTQTISSTTSSSGSITMGASSFSPAYFSASTGQAVIWTNTSSLPHTVTGGNGSFDSGILMSGGSFSHTFHQPGTYNYNCILHPGMSGSIAVTGASLPGAPTSTPTPAPTPTPSPPQGPQPPPASQPSPPGPTVTVSVGDDFFSPASISINQGSAISWTNNGRSPHTVTAANGSFNSGTLQPGRSYSYTFNVPGTHSYDCIFHSGMRGTVIVNAAQSPAPSPGVSPPGPNPAPAPAPPTFPIPQGVQMTFSTQQISPTVVSVQAGGSVTFVNNDSTRHRVRYEGSGNTDFDSGDIQPGGSWTRTFPVAGTYRYYDHRNGQITGTVRVLAPGQAP